MILGSKSLFQASWDVFPPPLPVTKVIAFVLKTAVLNVPAKGDRHRSGAILESFPPTSCHSGDKVKQLYLNIDVQLNTDVQSREE